MSKKTNNELISNSIIKLLMPLGFMWASNHLNIWIIDYTFKNYLALLIFQLLLNLTIRGIPNVREDVKED